MAIKRREFLKACAAVSALLLPGSASSAKCLNASNAPPSAADLRVEKSIKASFGGGFSVRAHTQSNGLTYADIEHFGNRYAVASTNLLDWEIVGSSLSHLGFASPSVSTVSIFVV